MLLFVVYAVLVCYGAFIGRRRLGGWAAIAAGILILVMVNTVHGHIARVFHYGDLLPVFRVLMYPYMGLVFACGVFFVMLPIELPRGELHCRLCRYDLTDLIEEMQAGGRCPECGATLAMTSTRRGRRQARLQQRIRDTSSPEPMTGLRIRLHPLSGQQSDDRADQQDQQRQPPDEEPAGRRKSAV